MSSSATPVAERVLPVRNAARKAKSHIADQLASSSPVRPSTPQTPDSRSPKVGGRLLDDVSDLSNLSDDEDEEKTLQRYSKKAKETAPPADLAGSVTSPEPRHLHSPVLRTYSRKKRPSIDQRNPVASSSRISLSPASTLTPLSAPPCSPSKRKNSNFSLLQTSPSKRHKQSDSPSDISRPAATSSKLATKPKGVTSLLSKTPLKKIISPSPSFTDLFTPQPAKSTPVKERWSKDSLGSLVWVRINQSNELIDDGNENGYWWPAKVSDTDIVIKVILFRPPSPSKPSSLEIKNPSEKNILSHMGPLGQQRFNISNFQCRPTLPIGATPSKPSPVVQQRWVTAVKEMQEADIDINDGLPDTISAALLCPVDFDSSDDDIQIIGQSTRKASGKKKGKEPISGNHPPTDEIWTPEEVDQTIEIPGEPVLSLEKKNRTEYWPAQVLEYVPPTVAKERGRYKLLFLDLQEALVTRDMFFSQEQDGFHTCKLGKFVSIVNESDASGDEDEEQELPFTYNPPIPPPRSFMDLSINEQFSYLIPILDVVMRGAYHPSNGRHTIFMKGGRGRSALSNSAGAKGDLSSKEVDKLLKNLIRYAITDDRVIPERVERRSSMDVDVIPDEALGGLDVVRPAESEEIVSSYLSPPPTTIGHDDLESAGTRTPAVGSPHTVTAQSPAVIPPSSLPPPPSSERSFAEIEMTSVPSDRDTLIAAEALGALRASQDLEPLARPDTEEVNREANREADGPAEYLQSFNELSEPEKIDYCTNVLLPEAIVQLLLWRAGERKLLHPLSEDEEAKLHERGSQLLHKTDFVLTIKRLRQMKEKKSTSKQVLVGGTRSRPRLV